jgi:hypothetical protein
MCNNKIYYQIPQNLLFAVIHFIIVVDYKSSPMTLQVYIYTAVVHWLFQGLIGCEIRRQCVYRRDCTFKLASSLVVWWCLTSSQEGWLHGVTK